MREKMSLPLIPSSELPPSEEEAKSEQKEGREERPIQRIALATTNQMDSGVRAVSAALKAENFDVLKLKLYEDQRHKSGVTYSEEEVAEIAKKIEEFKADMLAISIFEYGSNRAFALMKEVKEKLGIPVVLGGQHAMQNPKECFEAGADAVCVGEGESGTVALIQNWDKRFERVNRNFVVKQEDLDQVPLLREGLISEKELREITPDWSNNNYFLMKNGQLIEWKPEHIQNPEHHQTDRDLKTFIYASDRGCPLNCSFCYNSSVRKMFIEAAKAQGRDPEKYVRRKDAESVMKDLRIIKKENPWVEFLNIMNDDTAYKEVEDLQLFAKLYREEINWPFYCMVSPQSLYSKGHTGKPEAVSEGRQKIQALVDAGLKELNMGIQTNEVSAKRIYNRPQSETMLLQVTDMLHEFSREDLSKEAEGKIDLFYDFIIHNPLESRNRVKMTIDMIKKIQTPYDLVSHTLYIGKKSQLRQRYEKLKTYAARREGLNYKHTALEDITGETDFHDTDRFYDHLKDNHAFVVNTAIEFMAGRHDEKMTGRIPRYARDLMDFDVFKELRKKHPDLDRVLSQQEITDDLSSVDLLVSDSVERYFSKENQDSFKELFFAMKEGHPIRYSNESKALEAGPSREGRRFTEG